MSDDTKTDVPDIPAHIAARKAAPLTRETAELTGNKKYVDDGGEMRDLERRQKLVNAAAAQAEARARKFAGPYPCTGLTPTEINIVRGLVYEGAPEMDPALGDRTPAFVNWLWAKHPWDAAKRFGGSRDIWPTHLPAVWPPPKPAVKMKVNDSPKLYTEEEARILVGSRATVAKTYTQAEVDKMIQDATAGKTHAVIARPPRAKRTPAKRDPAPTPPAQ